MANAAEMRTAATAYGDVFPRLGVPLKDERAR